MTGVVIKVETGFEEAERAFNRMLIAGQNPDAMLDEVGGVMVEGIRDNFERQSAPDGTPWPQSRRAQRQGGRTLQDRGNLIDSFTHLVGINSVEAGTDLHYAKTHHFGAVIKAKGDGYLTFPVGDGWAKVKQVTIPARPMVGFSQESEDEIQEVIAGFVEDAFGGE